MTDTSSDPTAAHVPLLDLIVIDRPDAEQLARFLLRRLGLGVGGWVEPGLGDSGSSWWRDQPDNPDGRAALALQRIDDWVAPTWPGGAHPQQFHLDFSVGDIDGAEPRSLELGAGRSDHQPSVDGNFRVFQDPAGHPFCLIR